MNPLIPTLSTPSGVWNPLLWLLVFLIALAISYLIYLRGEARRKEGMQREPFFSGNRAPNGVDAHVKANNIGWGFMEAMRSYYIAMRNIHTGIVNDYVGWFLGVLALMMFIFLLWGGAP